MGWRFAAAATLVAGLVVSAVEPADASTFAVTSTVDGGAGSLREAIDLANASPGADTVVLQPSQTYVLTDCGRGGLYSTDELRIEGNGSTVSQSCVDNTFLHVSHGPLTIVGTTLSGGMSTLGGVVLAIADWAAPFDSPPKVKLQSSTLKGGLSNLGGGLYAAGDVELSGSSLTGNLAIDTPSSDAFGGGAFVRGSLTASDSTIEGNRAVFTASGGSGVTTGGGVEVWGNATITNTEVSANLVDAQTYCDPRVLTCHGNGGGLSVRGSLTVKGGSLSSNVAKGSDLGAGGGLFSMATAPVSMDGTVLDGNHAAGSDGYGGALFAVDLTLDSAMVTGNSADSGGGVWVSTLGGEDGKLKISDSEISGNEALASSGGGLSGAGQATMDNVRFLSNRSAATGGGLSWGGPLVIEDSIITGNEADSGGGMNLKRLSTQDPTKVEAHLVRTTVKSNKATTRGGGFVGDDTPLEIKESEISGNTAVAAYGGGASTSLNGVVILEQSRVMGNSVTGDPASCADPHSGLPCGFAAGVAAGREVEVIDSEIGYNTATGSYGGLVSLGSVIVTRSRVHHNEAELGAGVGTIDSASEIRVSSSLIDSNHAEIAGAGVFTGVGSRLSLVNSTVTGNSAGSIAAGVAALGPTSVQFSTVAGNSAPEAGNMGVRRELSSDPKVPVDVLGSVFSSPLGGGSNCDVVDGVVSGQYSYSTDGSCGLSSASNIEGGGDPLLGALGDHGGPTLSMKPSVGSPLLDFVPPDVKAADGQSCEGLALDQRGVGRPQGLRCDVGAVELSVPQVSGSALSTDDQTPVSLDVVPLVSSDPDGVLAGGLDVRLGQVEGGTALAGSVSITFTPTDGLNGQGWYLFSVCASGGVVCSGEALVTVDVIAVTGNTPSVPYPGSVAAEGVADDGGVAVPEFTG